MPAFRSQSSLAHIVAAFPSTCRLLHGPERRCFISEGRRNEIHSSAAVKRDNLQLASRMARMLTHTHTCHNVCNECRTSVTDVLPRRLVIPPHDSQRLLCCLSKLRAARDGDGASHGAWRWRSAAACVTFDLHVCTCSLLVQTIIADLNMTGR